MEKSRIGPFALEQKLDPGQTGSVNFAIHVDRRQPVALKVFPAAVIVADEYLREQYEQEFRKLQRLRHPNIVRCYEGGFDDEQGYIAWEFVRGESLLEILRRRERLSWETVVEYALQIAEALSYAHQEDVLHGNLYLDKVLITDEQVLKLLDFRVTHHATPDAVPMKMPSVKDIIYTAPERLEKGLTPTVKSDLYSLGCLMYHLLTGRPPHFSRRREKLLRKIRQRDPQRVCSLVMDCPIWLDALVHQLLQRAPEQRPYSAESVTMGLNVTKDNMVQGKTVAEHAAGGISPIRVGEDRKEARRLLGRPVDPELERPPLFERPWFASTCLAVLLAAVVGVVIWLAWPPSEEKLFRKAQALMSSSELSQWRQAQRRYLEPLLERFPDGKYAEAAREFVERIEQAKAERRASLKKKALEKLGSLETPTGKDE